MANKAVISQGPSRRLKDIPKNKKKHVGRLKYVCVCLCVCVCVCGGGGGGGGGVGEVYKKFITFYLADFGMEHLKDPEDILHIFGNSYTTCCHWIYSGRSIGEVLIFLRKHELVYDYDYANACWLHLVYRSSGSIISS